MVIYNLINKNTTFSFNGEDSTKSSPYEVNFKKGKYFVELYGASGGGVDGGCGGYSYGVLPIYSNTILYFYVGGQGITDSTAQNTCIKGGFNGGGEACSQKSQSSGGGGTDIRTTKNDNYEDRIIVAGGGGGDGDGLLTSDYVIGGNGGGVEGGFSYGFSGRSGLSYGKLYSYGGTQSSGGQSYIRNGYSTNENGSPGIGGKCSGGYEYCGAGGGGYFGGGGGYDVTGGGGGSGFINYKYFKTGKTMTSTHKGNGIIYITILNNCQNSYSPIQFPIILILVMIFINL